MEPSVKSSSIESLVRLALSVQNYRATVDAIGLSAYLNDPMLLRDLVEKLPFDLKLDWARQSAGLPRVNIAVFDDWLFRVASCASTVMPVAPEKEVCTKEKNPRIRLMVHNDSSAQPPCRRCNGAHKLEDCKQFLELEEPGRWNFVRENKLCWRCLGKHFIRHLTSKALG
ncbi:uncharacterized protein [Drosophila pseudoobscura]|uniref:Uncharacterized protein n=1 Tax=Drosophila pseudoobscura pseudoobscura TaxID=46245 RepID=A0A6I8W9L1_DROPS|nr:uncharacterized protein LOC117184910 [Drosophila pseudoobscura]